MKKLALLMFAILILGCGTETPVVEEPEPAIEEPPPVVMEDEHAMPEDTAPPEIVAGSVHDGDVNVDPEPLTRDGITFEFTENLRFYAADILLEEKSLGWFPFYVVDRRDICNRVRIWRKSGNQFLEHNTEYTIEMYVQDRVCNGTRIRIKFRTKPR